MLGGCCRTGEPTVPLAISLTGAGGGADAAVELHYELQSKVQVVLALLLLLILVRTQYHLLFIAYMSLHPGSVDQCLSSSY